MKHLKQNINNIILISCIIGTTIEIILLIVKLRDIGDDDIPLKLAILYIVKIPYGALLLSIMITSLTIAIYIIINICTKQIVDVFNINDLKLD